MYNKLFKYIDKAIDCMVREMGNIEEEDAWIYLTVVMMLSTSRELLKRIKPKTK